MVNDEDYSGADELIGQATFPQPTVEGAMVFRALGEYQRPGAQPVVGSVRPFQDTASD